MHNWKLHVSYPLCPKGLRMHPTYRYAHTYGYHAQRYRCPLLFPHRTGQTCDHEQFLKEKGCLKNINDEAGGRTRVLMDRSSPLYQVIYTQRTSCERINSQAKELGIERPKVRNRRSVANLNTLTYVIINVRALDRAQSINRELLLMHELLPSPETTTPLPPGIWSVLDTIFSKFQS
ncbi:MAG: transposase, partial [Ktedonobacteraceae bacterium]|nr:transposase [Ktedonobacteraceae bacterium]